MGWCLRSGYTIEFSLKRDLPPKGNVGVILVSEQLKSVWDFVSRHRGEMRVVRKLEATFAGSLARLQGSWGSVVAPAGRCCEPRGQEGPHAATVLRSEDMGIVKKW